MIAVMRLGVTQTEIDATVADLRRFCVDVQVSVGVKRTLICLIGDEHAWDTDHIAALPGVERVERIDTPYQVVALGPMRQHSVVRIGNVEFGGDPNLAAVIAGPCAIEDRDLAFAIASAVQKAGATVLRGDAWKARTYPGTFQGLGIPALEILRDIKAETGLPFVVDVLCPAHIDLALEYDADCVRIGTRYMGDVPLLQAAGAQQQASVMIKRGMNATLLEWLGAAEYVALEGNLQIILCERGIRTFETAYRNTLDINAVLALREMTHLPVIIDPSHSGGKRSFVPGLSRAAIAAGASGLMMDVHPHGASALVDGAQAVEFDELTEVMEQVTGIAGPLGIHLARPTVPVPA
jgi:3-deoxy-7-phosphoheptulonate synthase